MSLSIDAESNNRAAAQEALKFGAGEQWPAALKMQRQLDGRPCLTINKTDTFVRSVVNNMRQQRPRIKVHPVSDGADKPVADVIQGLIRHIEVASNADTAYDTGADYQVRMGWGYWRILSEYVDEMSWDQELKIDRIRNPFSVYFDPSSIAPDGSDAKWAIITGRMRKDDFEAKYPGKRTTNWSLIGAGDDIPTKDEITVVEYLRLEEVPEDLCRLSDGSSIWRMDETDEELAAKNLIVIDKRKSMRIKLKWSKLSASDELEKQDCPGKYLTVIPVYGAELIGDGKIERYGMIKHLMDPARQYNFWRTSETEIVALAPKAPWVMAEGQDEGHEEEWDNANKRNYSRLKYKVVTGDDNQPLPPPQRLSPQQIPAASVNAAMAASEDMKAVAGMFDPALGAPGQETSGTMVAKRQQQSDLSNFHFYDNLTRSQRWTGLVLLDLIPHYYDTKRVVRIIGEDGLPDSVTLNDKQAIGKVLNDVTVGRYDVVMDTGPGYDTKRMAAFDALMEFAKIDPETFKVAGDIIARKIDAPGMDELADRLAMANPYAQMDKEMPKDLDPEVKQFVAGLMGKLQQAQQQLQRLGMEKQAKVFGVMEREQAVTQREHLKETHETDRLHLKELGDTERAELAARTTLQARRMQDNTSLRETLIDAHTDLTLERRQAMTRGEPNANRTTQ